MAETIATVGDLAGICGHDGTDWLKIAVDANGYLKVIGGGVAGALEVTQDTPGDLLMGAHQYDGSAWRKSNLLWGYNDRIQEKDFATSDGSSPTNMNGTAVPANEVWKVETFVAYHNDTVARDVAIFILSGGDDIYLTRENGVAAWVPVTVQVPVTLKEDDYVRSTCWSLAADKRIYLGYIGYKMDIDM